MPDIDRSSPEFQRLAEDAQRTANWKRWGPYLAERQWATVREDYSANGDSWNYFPHDHARSRAYRWGEDGLLGITDRECRLCFALALWNGRDPFLKERLFGLTNPQGNHGEDVKECYYYLDSTPTHSWMAAMYRYPQARFPYEQLIAENAKRGRQRCRSSSWPIRACWPRAATSTCRVEYAKAGPNDILIADHRHEPRPGGGPAAPAADALVPQHLELGLPSRGLLAQAAYRRWPTTAGHHRATSRSNAFISRPMSPPTARRSSWLFTDNVTNNRPAVQVRELEPLHAKTPFIAHVVEGEAGRSTRGTSAPRRPPGMRFTFRRRTGDGADAVVCGQHTPLSLWEKGRG